MIHLEEATHFLFDTDHVLFRFFFLFLLGARLFPSWIFLRLWCIRLNLRLELGARDDLDSEGLPCVLIRATFDFTVAAKTQDGPNPVLIEHLSETTDRQSAYICDRDVRLSTPRHEDRLCGHLRLMTCNRGANRHRSAILSARYGTRCGAISAAKGFVSTE